MATKTIDTDVCVIGAGPAGLTLTRECVGTPLRVLVVESGWYERDERAQALADSTVSSDHYTPTAMACGRRRQFGGTANAWSHITKPGSGRVYARTLPGEALDFEERSWQSPSGWAVGLAELSPYYLRAQSGWTGGTFDYEASTWARPNTTPLPLRDGPLITRISQHGPSDVFTHRYRDELLAADNVTILLGSTVVELHSNRTGRALHTVTLLNPDGSTCHISAKVFVLAAGGVENVQLLLLSTATRPGAPGNRHDNVGRYLTDHPEFRMGTIIPADRGLLDRVGFYDMHWVGNALISGFLTLSQEFKRHERLLNASAVLVPQPIGFGTQAERALRSLHGLRSGHMPPRPFAQLRSLVAAPRDAAAVLHTRLIKRYRHTSDHDGGYVWHRGGWSRPTVDRSRFGVLEVHAATEQSPDRHNQLSLGQTRDWAGRRKLKLRLQWSAQDQANLSRTVSAMAAEIEGSGLGRFRRWIEFTGDMRPVNTALHHPMGGTRMHRDPQRGVVDENCRVHGMDNLYVAGSSVFASGLGYANPTLTVLALSLRLADHIKATLGASLPLRQTADVS